MTRLHHLETALPTFDEEGQDEHDQPCAPDDEPYLSGAQQLGFQRQVNEEADVFSWLNERMAEFDHRKESQSS